MTDFSLRGVLRHPQLVRGLRTSLMGWPSIAAKWATIFLIVSLPACTSPERDMVLAADKCFDAGQRAVMHHHPDRIECRE